MEKEPIAFVVFFLNIEITVIDAFGYRHDSNNQEKKNLTLTFLKVLSIRPFILTLIKKERKKTRKDVI